MTRVSRFAVRQEVIVVAGTIAGPRKQLELQLILDTGASRTLIVPRIMNDLGYSSRDAEARTSVYSALGKEHGYMVRVARFATLGFAMPNFPINVFALAECDAVDGLICLNFLKWFNYEVRSFERCILASNVVPLAA